MRIKGSLGEPTNFYVHLLAYASKELNDSQNASGDHISNNNIRDVFANAYRLS